MSYNTTENPAGRRIAALLDAGSFAEIGGEITARSTDFNLPRKEYSVGRRHHRIRTDRRKPCICVQPGSRRTEWFHG